MMIIGTRSLEPFCLLLLICCLSPSALAASPEKSPQPREACIAFVGDLMHHCTQSTGARGVAGGEGYDFRRTFEATRELLRDADYAVGNLETPIDGRLKDHCFPKFSAPVEYLDALKDAGFDLVSLANNHALDRDSDGLTRTLERIEARGMTPVGVAPGFEMARVEIAGVPVTFFALTKFVNRRCKSSPCPVMLPAIAEMDSLNEEIRSEAVQGRAAIVLLHWMSEYQIRSRRGERKIVDALLEAGALLVIGTHSHVLGPAALREQEFRSTLQSKDGEAEVESHHRKVFVRYSLGNFVHAMKQFPAKLGGIDLVCIQHIDGMPTVSTTSFTPTYVRRNAGRDASRVFQPVPLATALNQCDTGEGPLEGLAKGECREMRTLRDHLVAHPDLAPEPHDNK